MCSKTIRKGSFIWDQYVAHNVKKGLTFLNIPELVVFLVIAKQFLVFNERFSQPLDQILSLSVVPKVWIPM